MSEPVNHVTAGSKKRAQPVVDRPINVILGWERVDEIDPDVAHDGCCTAVWRDPNGETWDDSCVGPEMDVDDMLAWLREHGLTMIGAQIGREDGQAGYWIEIGWLAYVSPTMKRACEFAIWEIDAKAVPT